MNKTIGLVFVMISLAVNSFSQTLHVRQATISTPDPREGRTEGQSSNAMESNIFPFVFQNLYMLGGDRSTNRAAVNSFEGYAEPGDIILSEWEGTNYLWQGTVENGPGVIKDNGHCISFVIVVVASNTTFQEQDIEFDIEDNLGLFNLEGHLNEFDLNNSVVMRFTSLGPDGKLDGVDDEWTPYPNDPLVGYIYFGIRLGVTLAGMPETQESVDLAKDYILTNNLEISSVVTVNNGTTNAQSCAVLRFKETVNYPPPLHWVWDIDFFKGAPRISVNTLPGIEYTIQRSLDLKGNNQIWTDEFTWGGHGDLLKYLVDNTSDSRVYYRVKRRQL